MNEVYFGKATWHKYPCLTYRDQRDSRFSRIFFIFTSRSRSRVVSIPLSLLEKEWRDFIFHFSLLEKSESYRYFTLFSQEKRVKLGPGYNLTSIFVPNCISKDSQISSKHKPQNISQISVLKSWPNPMLHVCPNLQHKKKLQEILPWYLDQTSAFLPNCRLYVPHQ